MADVTLTITLSDIEAHAFATLVASLGPEHFEHAYQHWLNHWKALEAYSPQVEANMVDLMGEAAERVYEAWLVLASMSSLGWDRDERPARVYAGTCREASRGTH